jgi:glycosyltransferase involved in cell wall biosynthesis
MRVLILHMFNLDLTGGSGTYLRAVHRELRELGNEVEVVSARRPDRFGCTTHALPFAFTLTFGPEARAGERRLDELGDEEFDDLAASAAASIVERFGGEPPPDLVVVNHISLLAAVAVRLRQRWSAPYRIVSFGTDTDLLRRAPRYVGRVAAAAQSADRVFAISGFVAREIEALLPVDRIEVLGVAADRRVFFPAPDTEEIPPVVIYAGRLVTEKGLQVLLDAVERTAAVERLDIVGEGPLRAALSRRLDEARPAPSRRARWQAAPGRTAPAAGLVGRGGDPVDVAGAACACRRRGAGDRRARHRHSCRWHSGTCGRRRKRARRTAR